MGKKTGVQWCDHTFNPWWGCVKVSEGCEHCYAETFDHRLGGEHWGPNAPRRFFSDKHWNDPIRWNRAAEKDGVRRRVFCASMADVFEDRLELDEWRTRLWRLIHNTPWLDWLLLTKRPQNFAHMLPWVACYNKGSPGEPWPNVWLGVTAENQKRYDERWPILMQVPAVVRFISYEPALGKLWLKDADGLHWVIGGSESGNGARPADMHWYYLMRNQCEEEGIAFFLKQHACNGIKIPMPKLDGQCYAEFPVAQTP